MTREEAIARLKEIDIRDALQEDYDALYVAIQALEAIKALSADVKLCQKSITDEKVLIGFNMAVALTNKHLSESEK